MLQGSHFEDANCFLSLYMFFLYLILNIVLNISDCYHTENPSGIVPKPSSFAPSVDEPIAANSKADAGFKIFGQTSSEKSDSRYWFTFYATNDLE